MMSEILIISLIITVGTLLAVIGFFIMYKFYKKR